MVKVGVGEVDLGCGKIDKMLCYSGVYPIAFASSSVCIDCGGDDMPGENMKQRNPDHKLIEYLENKIEKATRRADEAKRRAAEATRAANKRAEARYNASRSR